MLSNFQCGDRRCCRASWSGQPELRKPDALGRRWSSSASASSPPITSARSTRPRRAATSSTGCIASPGRATRSSTTSAIHAIFVATGGIPRRINAICNRLMLAGFLAGQHAFTAAEVNAVVNEITGEIGPQAVAHAAA